MAELELKREPLLAERITEITTYSEFLEIIDQILAAEPELKLSREKLIEAILSLGSFAPDDEATFDFEAIAAIIMYESPPETIQDEVTNFINMALKYGFLQQKEINIPIPRAMGEIEKVRLSLWQRLIIKFGFHPTPTALPVYETIIKKEIGFSITPRLYDNLR